MPRLLFQNEIWSKLEKIMLQKRIYNKSNLRLSVEAIGKSRAGNTSKIHLAVDGYGLPIEFIMTGAQTVH